jgi:hypothetical protein
VDLFEKWEKIYSSLITHLVLTTITSLFFGDKLMDISSYITSLGMPLLSRVIMALILAIIIIGVHIILAKRKIFRLNSHLSEKRLEIEALLKQNNTQISKLKDKHIKDARIKLDTDKNLPSPKVISISQDLIDRWKIDWKKLSSIINHNCLPAYYHTGLTGDYRPIESIAYEGDYHHNITQKETILSFYFKESDVKRLENILKNIAT